MTTSAFYTEFVLSLTQFNFSLLSLSVQTIGVLVLVVGLIGSFLWLTQSVDKDRFQKFCSGTGISSSLGLIVISVVIVGLLDPKEVLNSYCKKSSEEYVFNGYSLYTRSTIKSKKVSSNVAINSKEDGKNIGQVECGSLSVKDCFDQVVKANPIAGDSPVVIDVSANQTSKEIL